MDGNLAVTRHGCRIDGGPVPLGHPLHSSLENPLSKARSLKNKKDSRRA